MLPRGEGLLVRLESTTGSVQSHCMFDYYILVNYEPFINSGSAKGQNRLGTFRGENIYPDPTFKSMVQVFVEYLTMSVYCFANRQY